MCGVGRLISLAGGACLTLPEGSAVDEPSCAGIVSEFSVNILHYAAEYCVDERFPAVYMPEIEFVLRQTPMHMLCNNILQAAPLTLFAHCNQK